MSVAEHLISLKPFSIITVPRGGSEYLQSLLDGNPEILLYVLNFQFFSNYIENIKCRYNKKIVNVEDFIYEFVGNEIWRFNTLYHYREGLDRLGHDMNESLNINKNQFIKLFLEIINAYEPTEKNLLLSLYASYHLCLGRDIFKTKIILHHSHTREEDILFKKSFPETKTICCLREPRSSIYSIVNNVKNNFEENYHYYTFYDALNVLKNINQAVKKYHLNESWLFIKLEDLPREDILKNISSFLGVQLLNTMYTSTWGNLKWHGDRISTKIYKGDESWSPDRVKNNWENNLNIIDKIILLYSFRNIQVRFYQSKCYSKMKYILLLIAIMPISLELGFLNPKYWIKNLKKNDPKSKIKVYSIIYFFLKVRFFFLKQIYDSNAC